MNILKRLSRVRFLRNIGGALAGGLLAMVAYSAWQFSSSAIASLLPETPVVVVEKADPAVQEKNRKKVVERAKIIYEQNILLESASGSGAEM